MASSVREMQRHQARERERERYVEDTQKNLSKQRFFEVSLAAEDRASEKRMARLLAQQQLEADMEENMIVAEQQRRLKQYQLTQEERLAEELKRIKMDKLRDEKMRQQIRENSQELRELEAKLRSGYMNKERSTQIAEKEAMRYEELAREAAIIQQIKLEADRADEVEAQKAQERYFEMINYQAELEKQLAQREHQKQVAYEEFLRDKLMIDEIVRKIYEEDQKEKERELLKRKATQEFISEFQLQQKAFRAAEQQRMDEENRRLAQYAAEMRAREEQAVVEKKEREDARDALQKALGDEVQRKEREREEMEQIRQELYFEEQAEKARKAEKESIEKRIRDRLTLQADYEEQLRLKEVRRLAEKEEEEKLRKDLLAKFAEDERIEQLTAERRRQKIADHKRKVEELLEARRQRLALEKEQEMMEQHEQEELERMRKQIIEEERLRLLREHATKLIGFLPKGVIRSEDEAMQLGAEFAADWQRRATARHAADDFSDPRIDRELPQENTYAYRRLLKKF